MILSVVPAFIGMMALAFLPKDGMLWTRWGLYLMAVTGNLSGLLIWTILPSNVAGRTKKSVTGTVLFVAYCVGNSIGAQTFRAEWAPRYIPSIIICGIFFALECVVFITWRFYCEYIPRFYHSGKVSLTLLSQMSGRIDAGTRRLLRWASRPQRLLSRVSSMANLT